MLRWFFAQSPRRRWRLPAVVAIAMPLFACGHSMTAAGPANVPLVRNFHQKPVHSAQQTEAYYPLSKGRIWRYAVSGSAEKGGERVETVTNRWEVPAFDGSGTVVIAEINREEPGRRPVRYTIEYLPNGLIRSYDPTLPVPGVPIAKAPAEQEQTWGMNPGGGHIGYFGGLQQAGKVSEPVGGVTYQDCLKVGLVTRGDGYPPFNRETVWAPGVGPVKIVEQGADRTRRVLELVTSRR